MTDMRCILERKGYLYHAVPARATVGDALRVLALRKIGIVLVLDGETLVGVFSERDAIRIAVELGTLPMDLPIREAMTTQVMAVNPDTSVEDCMSLMTRTGIRHVPIMDGSQVVGLVSMRDVVQEVVALQETTIRGLETYIVGGDFLP